MPELCAAIFRIVFKADRQCDLRTHDMSHIAAGWFREQFAALGPASGASQGLSRGWPAMLNVDQACALKVCHTCRNIDLRGSYFLCMAGGSEFADVYTQAT